MKLIDFKSLFKGWSYTKEEDKDLFMGEMGKLEYRDGGVDFYSAPLPIDYSQLYLLDVIFEFYDEDYTTVNGGDYLLVRVNGRLVDKKGQGISNKEIVLKGTNLTGSQSITISDVTDEKGYIDGVLPLGHLMETYKIIISFTDDYYQNQSMEYRL